MRTVMQRILAVMVILTFMISPSRVFPSTSFNAQSDESERLTRLAGLAKLWGKVKYFHPALAYRTDIDWDGALITVIPKVRAAKTQAEYQDALQSMLDVTGDPALRIIRSETDSPFPPSGNVVIETQKTDTGDIIVIKTGNYFSLSSPENRKKIADLLPEVTKAKSIVFDLRLPFPAGTFGRQQLIEAFSGLERFISTTPLSSPGTRSRIHYGYEPQSGVTSGGYSSGFFIQDGKTIQPINSAKDIPCVFLMNENSAALVSTQGLQAKGKGLIVFDGDPKRALQSVFTMQLQDDLSVQLRSSESIDGDGTNGEIQPDFVVRSYQNTGGDEALSVALDFANNFRPSAVKKKILAGRGGPMRDKTYPDMQYPSLEYRLLAIFRIWNIVNEFFPYKDLMDKDWDKTLVEFIPKFENANNAREYALAVSELLTRTNDSHVRAGGQSIRDVFGEGSIPVQVRMIENMPVVFRFVDDAAAATAGIEIGDVILKVDGEDARTRLDWLANYTTGSNESSKMFYAANRFTRGPVNSTVTLTVRKKNGQEREIKLTRKPDFSIQGKERRGEIFKLLSPEIGYADLDRLTVQQLPELMIKFKDTKAIVFDMRGYPNAIAWSLAPLLAEKEKTIAALFERPMVRLRDRSQELFYQPIPPRNPSDQVYRGKTVMLIDERTISQAEHTGLFLRSANGTKFVGSQTAGANGDVTSFFIPGGIQIAFTGQSVRFPDGKQLQRIGLVPDVDVKPTIKGVQDGKDEVLEKAVQHLSSEILK